MGAGEIARHGLCQRQGVVDVIRGGADGEGLFEVGARFRRVAQVEQRDGIVVVLFRRWRSSPRPDPGGGRTWQCATARAAPHRGPGPPDACWKSVAGFAQIAGVKQLHGAFERRKLRRPRASDAAGFLGFRSLVASDDLRFILIRHKNAAWLQQHVYIRPPRHVASAASRGRPPGEILRTLPEASD